MLIGKDPARMNECRAWRNHGLDFATYEREAFNQQRQYDIVVPGFKANMNEIQAALGICQFKKKEEFYQRRLEIYDFYARAFADHPLFEWIRPHPLDKPGHHLFVVRLQLGKLKRNKTEIMSAIIEQGIQLSGAFKPVHLFDWYRKKGWCRGDLPIAEDAFERVFALPFYPLLTDQEVERVAQTVLKTIEQSAK
jgi:dTDP-4-amino-4,6-dideoxygalactose transaminase